MTKAPLTNDEARQMADTITHSDEYQVYLDPVRQHKPSDLERLLKQIGEKMEEFMNYLRELLHLKNKAQKSLTPPWTEEAMMWGIRALVVITVLLVLYALVRWGLGVYRRYRQQREAEKQHPVITVEARQQQKAEYLQMADTSFLAHQYRDAIHYLFLASVTQVIRHEQFHASHEMTNREITEHCDFSQCASPLPARQHFQELVYLDEQSWFGLKPVTEKNYQAMLTQYQAFNESLGVLDDVQSSTAVRYA